MRMTTVIVDERIVCRSTICVKHILAGMTLNKGHSVMFLNMHIGEKFVFKNIACCVHGELLIEMEDNEYCITDNDKLFSIIVFFI